MRIGVISDVHGNAMALEVVLARLRLAAVDLIINLGDCASGPLWPAETVRLLRGATALHVRGNHDRALGAQFPDGLGTSDRFAWTNLDAADRAWLAGLPAKLQLENLICFHARPDDDETYLMEEVVDGRLIPAAPAAVDPRLGGLRAPLMLCGHSHLPRVLQLADETLLINPGSVGCPAYNDDTVPPHVSESASPHARFAVVTIGRAIEAELFAIPYDCESAARQAERNGRNDWAHALRTGRARMSGTAR